MGSLHRQRFAYRKWLGLRARQKVQGAVVSNGMWLLWTMLQRDDRGKGGRDGSSTECLDGAVIAITEEEFGTPPDGADGEDEVEVEVEAEKEIGRAVESTKEDILSRRSRVIKWLGAPQSNNKHWYKTCYRPKGSADNLGYSECVEWKMGWITFGGAGVLGGWLKKWLDREGYKVVGVAQLQRCLDEVGDRGGFNRNKAVEAFEAYCEEFQRAG
ncbi:hypothetical protein BGZ57DRAFT_857076 [Hyaloscypha finlandica]|nr:hypothetical protein BGZ57DRAFT_857076 [Hyaloscypha finlandica]